MIMEELDVLNSVPVEYLVYGITMITIALAILGLKQCNYTFEAIIRNIIQEESGLTLSKDMDLDFLFPAIISYLEKRLIKENKRTQKNKIALMVLKNKFIQSVLIKYIRTVILPRLIE